MSEPRRPTVFSLPKLGLLGSLYFSQGLPFGFFTQALPLLLRKHGLPLGQIGLTSLLSMPWALKFLWAPVIDRTAIGRFGRRKSWIVPLQALGALTFVGLALSAGTSSMFVLMGGTLLLNFVTATQDVATDGLAVDLMEPSERGLANGVQVAGYRVGMIVGGGILLILHDRLGSARTFSAMAALTAVATIPVMFAREPARTTAFDTGAPRLMHFLKRPGVGRIVLLIVVYKAGDHFATGMLRPFLADLGLTLEDVGWLLGTVGFVAGLLGALAGGALVNRLGRRQSLVAFGLLQSAAVGGYAWLALGARSRHALYAACAAEHFAGGMATAALFTCMMDWCSRDESATDYTVQASAVVIATGAASALSGYSAQALGYFAHFCVAGALSLAAVALTRFLFPTTDQTRAVRGETPETA